MSLGRGVMQAMMQAVKTIGEPGIARLKQTPIIVTIKIHGGLDALVKTQPIAILLVAPDRLQNILIRR
jgi:hypothetical protein